MSDRWWMLMFECAEDTTRAWRGKCAVERWSKKNYKGCKLFTEKMLKKKKKAMPKQKFRFRIVDS
jgi:hypothetical protein